MKNTFIYSFYLILFTTVSFAQNGNSRLIIHKSNLVIETKDYEKTQELINDCTTKHTIKVNTINQVLKNKIGKVPQSLSAKIATFNMDYFGDGCDDFGLSPPYDLNDSYSLLFLHKDKEGYRLIKEYTLLDEELLNIHKKQIEEYTVIEKLNNPTERFNRTLDWFINFGLEPDPVFITYYTQQGYIKEGHIPYTDAQYKKAFSLFNGTQEVYTEPLSFIREKYYNELKESHLTQMQLIIDKKQKSFTDYYNFGRMVTFITNDFNNDYDNKDSTLIYSLTENKETEEEKLKIMKRLFEIVSGWEPNTNTQE